MNPFCSLHKNPGGAFRSLRVQTLSLPGAVGLAHSDTALTPLQKGTQSAFGTVSKQERLIPQACILNQFRSNTKEMPNQRAFYFLCFPCNPPDCLPVPGSAAGLKVTSLLSHSGELVLSVLSLMASSSKASYTTHL